MTDDIRIQLTRWRTLCDDWAARERAELQEQGLDPVGWEPDDSVRMYSTDHS